MKYASIDVGTNTVLLLIVENGKHTADIIDISTITRLGEGLRQSGFLGGEAMKRTFLALEKYRKIIEEQSAPQVFCVGTSALREAKNSAEFLETIRDKLKLSVRVISARDEAYYTYLSVKSDELIRGDDFVILDIGGGSTEVIKGNRGGLFEFVSLPVGTVKLTEGFVAHDPPSDTELFALAGHIRGLLKLPFEVRGSLLVGTGGTITNLASIVLGLESYEKDRIHNLRITVDEIDNLIGVMKAMSAVERRTIKGMEAGREDILLQGIILLKEIMVYFGLWELTVSTKGVRYGVIYERLGYK